MGKDCYLGGKQRKKHPPPPARDQFWGLRISFLEDLKKKKKIKREGGQVWKSCDILSRVEKIFYVTGQRWLPTQHSPLYSLP